MSDHEAIIAQQIAEQKLRDSIPGRYDDVLIRDLATRVSQVHEDIASMRQAHGEPAYRGDEADLALRELSETSPQANAVYHLRCALPYPVVALSDDGRPLTAPTMDLQQLLAWWRPGGDYATAWPGVLCEPGRFYGLQLSGAGLKWWDEIRVIKTLTRRERLSQWMAQRLDQPAPDPDPITEAGVPPSGGDGWDDDDQPARVTHQVPLDGPLRLVEEVPPASLRTTRAEAWFGGLRSPEGVAAMTRARGRQPLQAVWLCWQWPIEAKLPLGHLRSGVRAVPALPGEGAHLNLDGVHMRVSQWPPFMEPMPDWLIAELQKFGEG